MDVTWAMVWAHILKDTLVDVRCGMVWSDI